VRRRFPVFGRDLKPPRWARPLVPAAWIIAGAGLLWLAFGHGFANYDTFYALLWGNEIADGQNPDYAAPIPPTPHPLATFAGVLLAPLGDGAETVAVALGYVSLAALGYLVYRLGERWFNPWVGLLAAALVLTREPVLSNGVRVYVDIPYLALVLAALVVETKRPRPGWPVLALLALAGLLRPEAWLFSAAYLVYLAYSDPARPRGTLAPLLSLARPGKLLGLTALAASAPVIWAAFDLAVTGDPLYSLTGTQETVETLRRDTGLSDAFTLGPRRIGEIVREPVLIASAVGGLLALFLLRRRTTMLGAVAGALAVAAFLILAIAGLAVITRYLMLAGAILIVFAAAGALGWLDLDRDDPWRRRWLAFGVFALVLMVAWIPSQYDRLATLQDNIADQEQIRDDLHDLVEEGALARAEDPVGRCNEVTVPNHRSVPLLALWLDRRPSEIRSAELVQPVQGYFIDETSEEVERDFTLDPNDPGELTAVVPPDFTESARNDSWIVYERCFG
jgi:hypothetical protein